MNKNAKKSTGLQTNNKMPSIFKKSVSDLGSLSESHRKVLHRCRVMLIKDLDVSAILEYMSVDDSFSSVRDAVLSYSDRERQVAALLDRLETRGDRSFTLFMEAVREHHKHLHYVLEETLRDDNTPQQYRLSVSGQSIRNVITSKRKSQYSQAAATFDSIDELDSVTDDTYIPCYSIPFRGRLQRESWITQPGGDTGHHDDQSSDSYMAVVLRDLLFKRINVSEVPTGIKQPPPNCQVYVLDTDNKYGKHRSKVTATDDVDGSRSTLPSRYQWHTPVKLC